MASTAPLRLPVTRQAMAMTAVSATAGIVVPGKASHRARPRWPANTVMTGESTARSKASAVLCPANRAPRAATRIAQPVSTAASQGRAEAASKSRADAARGGGPDPVPSMRPPSEESPLTLSRQGIYVYIGRERNDRYLPLGRDPRSGRAKWLCAPSRRLSSYASVGGADLRKDARVRECLRGRSTMEPNGGEARFPLPSEIADAPGAEGWRSMYPYFTRFQPEDDKRFWFYNSMHFPEPMPAFDTITAEVPYSAIGANTARVFVFPTTLGIEHRIVNGRVYITANPVTDPDEIGRRAAVFGERAGYYYENWDTLYQGWKMRIKALIDEIRSITVPELPEFDDLAAVTESRGVAQNHYVRENFHRCIDLFSKMWHHHTEFLMLGYGAYVVFFQFCKQAFPEISDQAVARMVAGIDVIMYRPDDELRQLARLAVEAGVADLFTESCSPPAVLAALAERGDGGQRWLSAFERA